MGNALTIKQDVDFFILGLDFAADDTLIVGGGGDSSSLGFKNNLVRITFT